MRYTAEKSWLGKWHIIISELQRTARQLEVDYQTFETTFELAIWLLEQMRWEQVYTFCERMYDRVPISQGYVDEEIDRWIEGEPIEDIKQYFSEELNSILAEENLAYNFADGQFQRQGRAQTQKNIQRVGAVLANPTLFQVRDHYNKAKNSSMNDPIPMWRTVLKKRFVP